MKYLARYWQKRTLIVLLISLVLSLAVWCLELTEVAARMNAAGLLEEAHDSGENRAKFSATLRFILPFVKLAVLTLVPAILIVAIRGLYRKIALKLNS